MVVAGLLGVGLAVSGGFLLSSAQKEFLAARKEAVTRISRGDGEPARVLERGPVTCVLKEGARRPTCTNTANFSRLDD